MEYNITILLIFHVKLTCNTEMIKHKIVSVYEMLFYAQDI